MPGNRAVALRRADDDGIELQRLVRLHHLHVVFTAFTDTAVPRVAVMIAAGHALEQRAEIVVVPHLTATDVWKGREWHALAEMVGVIGAAGVILGGGTDCTRL